MTPPTTTAERSPRAAGAADAPTKVLLEAKGLTAGFGTTQVLHGVDLQVREGEIAGIFGLNGAGKSVTMKTLAGLVPAWSGTVTFDGDDVTGLSPEARVARGIGNVPQGRQVFPGLTVEENLRLGGYTSRRSDRAGYADRLERVLVQFPILRDRLPQLAGTMSGGQQASLAVARALVNAPRLVLIDEPSAGLAPVIVKELLEILQGVAATGVTMVLVEQNVSFGLQLVDRANLLQTGRVVHTADVADLDRDTLARHLGIGRMLSRTTGAALADRQSTDDDPSAAVADDAAIGAEAPRPTRRRTAKRKPAARTTTARSRTKPKAKPKAKATAKRKAKAKAKPKTKARATTSKGSAKRKAKATPKTTAKAKAEAVTPKRKAAAGTKKKAAAKRTPKPAARRTRGTP